MQRELTPNEDNILQAIQSMKERDQLIIYKKAKRADTEFDMELRPATQITVFFKTK